MRLTDHHLENIMGFLATLSAAIDHIGSAETRALRAVRLEHDLWAAETARAGVTYYTALPSTYYDGHPIHERYTFVRRASWGPQTGQWLTDAGTPSWGVWLAHGLFTTDPRPTVADYRIRQEEIARAFEKGMEARAATRAGWAVASDATTAFFATAAGQALQREYPETAKALRLAA
ncbi:hypothetical protein ACFCX4_09035 [Kitasatospora sp. NPDC056327]|uniref:hypothetical protein n=1 Tax=Kitasatospora sp. NPDC056327 TaxID=3345785 RepID=UPI0035DBF9D9